MKSCFLGNTLDKQSIGGNFSAKLGSQDIYYGIVEVDLNAARRCEVLVRRSGDSESEHKSSSSVGVECTDRNRLTAMSYLTQSLQF